MPSAAENATQSPMEGSPTMGSMSKKTIAGTLRHFSPKKTRPTSIYLPPIRKQSLQPPPQAAAPIARVAVELSKFPPTFTKRDIHILFQGYHIEDDVAVGNLPQFLYPLRATVFFQSVDEAARAVSSMDGMLVRGKPIEVRVVDSQGEQAKEMEVKRQAEDLKSDIISESAHYHCISLFKCIWICSNRMHNADSSFFVGKARTHNPDYMNAVLEVRELEKGNTNYAFLQSRTLIQPMDSPRTKSTHANLSRNIVKWDLIAAGTADLDVDAMREDKGYDVRIEALKNLLFEVEDWATLVGVWKGWEGSWMLDSRCSRIGR